MKKTQWISQKINQRIVNFFVILCLVLLIATQGAENSSHLKEMDSISKQINELQVHLEQEQMEKLKQDQKLSQVSGQK